MTWRWGVAGPGAIAERFATDLVLVEDATIAAVASRSQARAEAFARRHGINSAYGSLEAMLEDPAVDVVYVATPNSCHARDTIAALEAGKHVLCEKPLAPSADGARQMVLASRQRGLFLMEAMWSRFLPAYQRLAAMLDEGAIGEPVLVEATLGFPVDVGPDHRLLNPALGGGATLDLGVYPVQLASLVLGPPLATSAQGTLASTGVDDLAAAVLSHPGERLSVVTSSLRIPLSCSARITGTGGHIDLPAFLHCPTHLVLHRRGVDEHIATPHGGDGIRFQVHEVHRCLESGRTESTSMALDESIDVARTLDEIRHQVGVAAPRASTR